MFVIGRRCPQPDRKAGNFSVYNNALAEMQEPGASWTPRSQGSSGVLSIGRDKRLSSILDDRARELRKSTLRTPRPNEEYITALRKGNYMFKYGRQGKPHKAHFQMSEDLAMLSWTSKKGKGQEKRRWIDMSAVQVVEAGQGTVVFQRFPDHEHLKRLSFSILYKKKGKVRTLDIVCSNAEEYELWFVGLDSVHRGIIRPLQQKTAEVIDKLSSSSLKLDPVVEGSKLSESSVAEDNNSCATNKVSSATEKSSKPLCPVRELIGDVYIWGAPSGAVVTGRTGHGTATDGLQEAWVPTLVNDTFRLDVASVSCGPRHAALITKNGETYTWGCGDAGRLGHGDCQSSGYPKMVLELSGRGVTQLACGDWHTAAITRDGSLYTWGDGTAGILGHGNPHRHWSPKRVERPLQGVIFTRVAAGPYHTAAVTRTGDLYTWGDGFGGKLGHGGHDTYLQPRRVEKLVGHRVTHVATGVWHTVCVTVEPAAHQTSADSDQSNPAAIARSSSEKAKEGAVAGAAVQQRPSAPAGQTAIADGSKPGHHRRSSKMRDKGVVWSWGGGDKGCLGVGDEDGRMEPERMHGGPESVRAVCAGLHFTLMLSAGGKVWLCGMTSASGYDGQTIPAWEGSMFPVRVKGALGGLITAQIAAGMHHIAVIAGPVDNPMSEMYTWGRGTEGQLGHGQALPGSSPSCPEPRIVKQLEGRRLLQVACGGCNTMAVVEHDAKANLKNYDIVTKELDDLLPRKMAPPAGLLIGGNALQNSYQSPAEQASGSGYRHDGRRSRTNSILGDVAHTIASGMTGRRGPDSDCATSHGGGRVRQNRSGTFGPAHSELVPPTNPGGTPSIFICPITREAFEDPVVAADGYTYERSAIVQWLRNNSKSPMTNMELDHKSLTPNISVRSGIDEWRQWRGLAKEGLRGGRHLQTPSIGGSSQGSFSNLMPPPAMHAGGFQGAVILANPVAMGSACSARSDSSSDPLRALGERL